MEINEIIEPITEKIKLLRNFAKNSDKKMLDTTPLRDYFKGKRDAYNFAAAILDVLIEDIKEEELTDWFEILANEVVKFADDMEKNSTAREVNRAYELRDLVNEIREKKGEKCHENQTA